MYFHLIYLLITPIFAVEENVLLTEVFTITLDPLLFNWTYEGDPDQYVYQASLLDSPDLPSWIKYVFSEKHKKGFLYGVPPNRNMAKIPLQVVALNTKNYDTRIRYINIHISEKLNPAKFEVLMKIDNVNVEDIFDVERMESLRDIFRKHLWKDSENDLYVTYLESATELGARKPLDPDQEEGIVIRLGSQSPFSKNLKDLEDEVRPLWKGWKSCPRNFKKTSVERYFRDARVTLDWCAFRLIDPNNSAMHHSGMKENAFLKEKWETITKDNIPIRNYSVDVTWSLVLPIALLILLTFLLSFILCFYHDGIYRDEYPNKMQTPVCHKPAVLSGYKPSSNLIKLSPDPALGSRSHTNSPSSTINRGVHCRPSPPPYMRPRFRTDVPQDEQISDEKNWYC
ncbi:epsilon-sarcoglycan isoform X2 [Coccinella septempunctata]|uniref:epsilon-sarcoglycan isoform X2 n=1 Tax=Coccinella septempunctata TaxID=41139 RepID=UPI001D0658AC|nr:epsilon-sarcoglycan isoform X2 [Coccinella septempunctata]